MEHATSLYDSDFYAWTQEQTNLLKHGNFAQLDLRHLIEEVEDMGNQNKHELRNRLAILIMHLLKWKYQPERRGNSWYQTISNQRLDIADLIDENPSLKNIIPELMLKSYTKGLLKASIESGINKHAFPSACEWSIEQILHDEFFPS